MMSPEVDGEEGGAGEWDGCQWARRAMQGEGDWRGSVEKEGR